MTHLETDVRASIDGVAVLSHDETLSRVAGSGRRVDELLLAELEQIDLGLDQVYTRLIDALQTFPHSFFNIDVKADAAILPTVEAIRLSEATDRVLVTAFNDRRRRDTVRLLPGVATSASVRATGFALFGARAGLTAVTREALRSVQAVQVPERLRGVHVVTGRTVRAFHSAGVEVHVWTVNDPVDMGRLLDLGVDGLVTDRSDLALGVLRDRGGIRE